METTTRFVENSGKNSQLNITKYLDNILVSRYWGTKTVIHTMDFCPKSFKTKVVRSDNIQTTLRKSFLSKVWYQLFWNYTFSSVFFLGVYLLLSRGCSWYLFSDDVYSMHSLISSLTWTCSRKKGFSLYLGKSQENYRHLLTELTFFFR